MNERRVEMMSPMEAFGAGQRHAWKTMLRMVATELAGGLWDSLDHWLTLYAKWIIEREQVVAALRDVCADFGDNDWHDNLNLADVIEKHLRRHLDQLPTQAEVHELGDMLDRLRLDRRKARIEELNPFKTRLEEAGCKMKSFGNMIEEIIEQRDVLLAACEPVLRAEAYLLNGRGKWACTECDVIYGEEHLADCHWGILEVAIAKAKGESE